MIQCSPQLYNELHTGQTSLYVTAEASDMDFLKEDFQQTSNSYVISTSTTGLPIGVAVQGTLTLVLINKNNKFTNYKFKNRVLTVYINADLTTDQTEHIKLGKFTVISATTSRALITLSLVDDMYLAEKPFTTSLSFPVSAKNLLANVCNTCGIPLGDTTFENGDIQLYKKPTDVTFRDIIANIALIAGGVAIIDEDNYLRIRTIDTELLNSKFWIEVPTDYASNVTGTLYTQGDTFTNYDTIYIEPQSWISVDYGRRNYTENLYVNYESDNEDINSNAAVVFSIDVDASSGYFRTGSAAMFGTLQMTINNINFHINLVVSGDSYFYPSANGVNGNVVYPNDWYQQDPNNVLSNIRIIYIRKVSGQNKFEVDIRFYQSFYNELEVKKIVNMQFNMVYAFRNLYTNEGAPRYLAGNFTNNYQEDYNYDGGSFTDVSESHNLDDAIKLDYEKDKITGCTLLVNYSGSNGTGTRTYGVNVTPGHSDYNNRDKFSNVLTVDLSSCIFLETDSSKWSDAATGLERLDLIGSALGAIVHDFFFTPFSSETTANPIAELCDMCYFYIDDGLSYSFISDIQFTFGGTTQLSNTTQTQQDIVPTTSSSITAVANAIRTVDRDIQPYDVQVEQLNYLANSGLPYFITEEVDGNSIITYYHNQSSLSSSTVVYKICTEGIFLSKDGGNTWISGFDKDGNLVCYTGSIGQLVVSNLEVLTNATINNIGTIKNAYLSEAKSVYNETSTALCSVSLPAGKWLITFGLRFPSNSTGDRWGNVATTSGNTSWQVRLRAASGGITQLRGDAIVSLTSTTTYYLNAVHNSGSTLTLPAGSSGSGNFIRAIRIC